MKIFIDTSSLFKLYHNEADSAIIENIFITNSITQLFLSEITRIEFSSAVWKKVRTKEISNTIAEGLTASFESDLAKYTFVQVDSAIINEATRLVSIYGANCLRSLDSIQLATALLLRNSIAINLTSDLLVKKIMMDLGLTVI